MNLSSIMNLPWPWLLILGLILFWLLHKRSSEVSLTQAVEWLQKGAIVVDVRSTQEYAQGHLPGVISVPLGSSVPEELLQKISKTQPPVLLHCASGMRSASALSAWKQAGVQNVHNLGSYQRAQAAVTQANWNAGE